MKATLLLLGSMCAFSLACSGGYGADEAPDTDTASTPRQVARAAETPAPAADEQTEEPAPEPAAQPTAVPATTPGTSNQPPATHADAGPPPAVTAPAPSTGDAGPAPVLPEPLPLVADDQPTDDRGEAGCASGYATVCERAPCIIDGQDGTGVMRICRAALPENLPAGAPCHADESCHAYSSEDVVGYCKSPYGSGPLAGSCQTGPRPSPLAPRCHWHDLVCLAPAS